jgi:hypothetical protein
MSGMLLLALLDCGRVGRELCQRVANAGLLSGLLNRVGLTPALPS